MTVNFAIFIAIWSTIEVTVKIFKNLSQPGAFFYFPNESLPRIFSAQHCHNFHSIFRGSSLLRILISKTHKQIIVANILFSSKFCIGKRSITSQNLRSHLAERDPTVGSQSNGMKIKTQPHQPSPRSLLMGQKPSLPFLQHSSTPQRQKIYIYIRFHEALKHRSLHTINVELW